MSSGSRGGPPMGRYGTDHDHGKRRKNYYASSTRRDFKSSAAPSAPMTQGPGPFPSSHSKPLHRAEKPLSDPSAKPRYRDAPASSLNPSPSGLRSTAYNKDARYGGSGPYTKPPYSAFQQGHYSERNAAYGSFSNHNRDSDSYGGYGLSSRDATSRDLISSNPQRNEAIPFNRDSWRGERPKLNSAGSSKSFSSPSRFNPNNIPVHARGNLSGLMGSVKNEHSNDRYDSYNDDSPNRWKPSYPTSRPEKLGRSPNYGAASSLYPLKDRGRSSALTNSMGGVSRTGSYLNNHNGNRFVDRYPRSSPETKDRSELDEKPRHYADLVHHESDRSMDKSRDFDSDDEEGSASYERHPSADVLVDKEDEEVDEEEEDLEEEEEEDDDDENHGTGNAETTMNLDKMGDAKLTSLKADEVEPHHAEAAATSTSTKMESSIITIDPHHVDYPNGCIYPIPKLDAELADLDEEFKLKIHSKLVSGIKSYKLMGSDITQYPTYKENLLNFSLTSDNRIKLIKERKRATTKKKLALWMEYEKGKSFNDLKRKDLEEQLQVIHPADDECRRELSSIDIRAKQSIPVSSSQTLEAEAPPQTSRRGRRHGDLVTTEAEFQEILKSLENEQDEDPMAKAIRVSASIPNLILDATEASSSNFMDSNNIVHDKQAWALRIRYDFMDNFTEKEHDLFCEAFCRSPKRFGEISRYMGGFRSAEECVAHYYMTKKAMSYKFLVSQFKKKASRKNSRRKSVKLKTPTTAESNEISESINSEEFQEPPLEEKQNPPTFEQHIPSKRPMTDETKDDTETSEELTRKKSRRLEEEALLAPLDTKDELSEGTNSVKDIDMDAVKKELNESREGDQSAPVPQNDGVENSVESGVPPTHTVLGLPIEPPEVPDQKRQNSSYWSITDVNEFPNLLTTYGSKWSSIADHFPTKTATMVRNYFQRNAEKYGWNDIVTAADRRLAQGSNVESEGINSVDATIVVKPQRNTAMEHSTHGMQVQSMMNVQDNSLKPLSPVPMGTFQHPAQIGNTPEAPAKTRVPYPERDAFGVLLSAADIKGENMHAHTASARPEGQKPSIMSLLNSDATPVKPIDPGPALVAIKSNNLSALLNAQSPTPAPLRETQVSDRRNSVKSLLQD